MSFGSEHHVVHEEPAGPRNMPKQLPNTLKRTQNGHKSTLNEAVLQVFHRFSLLFVDLHDLPRCSRRRRRRG